MTLPPKRIFVLDDDVLQLEPYVAVLTKHGFEVRGAKTLDEVNKLVESNETFDLLLLDMILSIDPRAAELNVYGTDVGRQLLKKQNDWPPVVLTMTSFNQEVEHWRKSFDVGAITLLEKSLTTEEEISYYAATVLLRRALGLNNPDCKKAIQEVLETGRTAFQVLENFFRQFVVPEFASCIDTPFVIVLEQGKAISEDPSQVQS